MDLGKVLSDYETLGEAAAFEKFYNDGLDYDTLEGIIGYEAADRFVEYARDRNNH